MKIVDSAIPHHRVLTLDANESLDSAHVVLSLIATHGHSIDDAQELVSELFDAIENMAIEQRYFREDQERIPAA